MGCKNHRYKRILIDEYAYDSQQVSIDLWQPTGHTGGCNPSRLAAGYAKSTDGSVEITDFGYAIQECPFSTQITRRRLIYDHYGNQIAFVSANPTAGGGLEPGVVPSIVTGTIGKKWKGAQLVTVDFRNPIRVIKIYK